MSTTVSNPRDLYLVELCDILYVERQLAFEVLPSLLAEVKDSELSAALGEHLTQTKQHAERVEEAFRVAGAEPSAVFSDAFSGLRKQHDQQASAVVNDTLADAWHAAAAAHAEHYEIAAYEGLLTLAGAIGLGDAVDLLGANLTDEREALEQAERAYARLAGAE
jgi:ferritin-like metal-binding protein YciE